MVTSNYIINTIKSDNALASILSNFNTSYIIDMVRNSIGFRFRPYGTALPTLNGIESAFNSTIQNTPDTEGQKKILDVREQTYQEIINEVCRFYGLEYIQDYNQDIFSSAYWIYDFFVSNFTVHYLSFYSNYIFQNKSHIYQYLNLEAKRKEKDSSTIYNRAIDDDIEIAMIHANISMVLDNLCYFDITLDDIINYDTIYDKQIKDFLHNVLKDINGDVYKNHYAKIYLENKAECISAIKLSIGESIITNAKILETL